MAILLRNSIVSRVGLCIFWPHRHTPGPTPNTGVRSTGSPRHRESWLHRSARSGLPQQVLAYIAAQTACAGGFGAQQIGNALLRGKKWKL
eukprot:gene8948-biopygen18169